MRRCFLALFLVFSSSLFAATTVDFNDTIVAPKSSMGINVSSNSANIINGGCFEAAADSNGFASEGWGWFKSGTFTASVDTSTFVSGKQSQKVAVGAAPVAMEQATVDLPQAPFTRVLTPSGKYMIKVMLKSGVANARVQLGIIDGGWAVHYSPAMPLTTSWGEYSWSYTPTTSDLWRGVSIQFLDNTNYWIDNLASWDANNTNAATGFAQTYVDRLTELKPAMLRLGGLGVNSMTLEHYLFKTWPLSYAPPPNEYLHINTFMALCKTVNASPFITVPPAFTDTASAAATDLTSDLVANHFADHGNLVDYLGGDGTTTYGARRTNDGFARWDTQFPVIYYEMGNETWGTPDGLWDMHLGLPGDPWMQTYATYCTKRMTEMKSRAGWRANMKVGFGGFAADSDSWAGYSTILIPAIKNLADFGTIFMYYGSGSNTNSDEEIYGGLFAKAQWHQRTIKQMNTTYATAAGHALECCIYEGNCVWGNYYNGPSANDTFVYSKEVSAGAAASLLDNYAAGNRAGVKFNNHFAFTGGSWSSLTAEPNFYRKPAYQALKIFNNYISGNLITSTVNGSATWNDTLTGESNVPYVACYPYKNGSSYSILVVNRHRTAAQTVTLNRALTVTQLVKLTAGSINANNESSEAVTLQLQSVAATGNSYTLTVPPFSAYVVIAKDPAAPNVPPTVTLTSPANGANFVAGSSSSLTASASDSDGIVTKVDFYAGATLIGSATSSPYAVTWSSIPLGTSVLTAVATDDTGAQTTSASVTISSAVGPGTPAAPVITSGVTASPSTVQVGQPTTFSVGATGSTLNYAWNFGDGSSATGATANHTFQTAGTFIVTVTITDGVGQSTTSSMTITVTDSGSGTGITTLPLSVTKMAGGMNFKKPGHDQCSISGALPELTPAFKPLGQAAVISIGGAQVLFTLNKTGSGKSGTSSFKLKLPKKGKTGGSFSAMLKGSFVAAWQLSGLDPAKTSAAFPLTATLTFNGNIYSATVITQYAGKPGVSGKFKK